jgi:hypothetical protein
VKISWIVTFVMIIFFSSLAQGGEIVVKRPKLDTLPHTKVETATFAMG